MSQAHVRTSDLGTIKSIPEALFISRDSIREVWREDLRRGRGGFGHGGAGVEGGEEPVGAVHSHVEELPPVPGHHPVLGLRLEQLGEDVAGHQASA